MYFSQVCAASIKTVFWLLAVMARFIVMTVLNVWVTTTVLYYKQGCKKLH